MRKVTLAVFAAALTIAPLTAAGATAAPVGDPAVTTPLPEEDEDDDGGRWGLLGLLGLAGLLGLKRRDDDDRVRTTGSTTDRR